jgi:phenol hydroxylase P4 protein
MSTAATYPYTHAPRDAETAFHGNRLTYWHWTSHLMFCAPIAFPLPPAMPFAAVVEQVFPTVYAVHPDYERIDWPAASWTLDGVAFTPDFAKSLDENGIGHKSVVTFTTRGLDGIGGARS